MTTEGVKLTSDYLTGLIGKIGDVITAELPHDDAMQTNCQTATRLLTQLVTAEDFPEFLTLDAYQALIGDRRTPMRLTEFDD